MKWAWALLAAYFLGLNVAAALAFWVLWGLAVLFLFQESERRYWGKSHDKSQDGESYRIRRRLERLYGVSKHGIGLGIPGASICREPRLGITQSQCQASRAAAAWSNCHIG